MTHESLMHPARDRMRCRAQKGDGPTFEAAGPVFEDLTEPRDRVGPAALTLERTHSDAEGLKRASKNA